MILRHSATSALLFLVLAAVSQSVISQQNPTDRLDAFVGTWTATAPGAQTPFLVLQLRESDGKLVGTASHVKLGVIGHGPIMIGTPEPGESAIAVSWTGDAEFAFQWDSDPILRGNVVKFMVQGKRKAQLVIGFQSPEQGKRFMDENPGVGGVDPVITVYREGASEGPKWDRAKWESRLMATLINTAEAQYKFAHGLYADYATLVQSGQLESTDRREFKWKPPNISSTADPLPGYSVRLVMEPDGSSYRLFILEKNNECGANWFSDETGIIVGRGRAGDCRAGV
jgi:hypothetical protein